MGFYSFLFIYHTIKLLILNYHIILTFWCINLSFLPRYNIYDIQPIAEFYNLDQKIKSITILIIDRFEKIFIPVNISLKDHLTLLKTIPNYVSCTRMQQNDSWN